MSIPITCSGCKSAFDVPDNLAGKTIRCTSCKAQMTVPEDLPVDAVEAVEEAPAAGTKKPFGSGSRPALTAAAPKRASDPAPKTNPAKPVAKAAVVEDEDEDEEKDTKKSGKDSKAKPTAKVVSGPKKPGIVGAAKKRRADDDDDDDDDEDDAPRKKKKKAPQGGAGPMVAIIAGATIALALVAGLGIYFLSGSKDADGDTASNTSNTSNTVAPGSGDATRPGGMPGPGGPGRNSSAMGPPPGMRPPVGGTGTASPAVDDVPGNTIIPPKKPGVTAPGIGGPGAPGGSGGGNPFAGLSKVDRLGTPGPWAAFNGNGFTAEFPGTPETKNETAQGLTLNLIGVGAPDAATALAIYVDLPQAAVQAAGNNPQTLLNTFMTGVSQASEFKNKTATDTTVDGHPAKEVSLNDSEGEGKMRIAAAKNRIFMFIAGGRYKSGQPTMPRTDVDRFFNSIKITYKGDLVAGGPGALPTMPPGGIGSGPGRPPGESIMPPGGIGMPPGGTGMPPGETGIQPGGIGQPPGGIGMPPGGIGQPPGGIGNSGAGSGDGHKKANIENFYAAAFDPENKELYTIDDRVDPRDPRVTRGWLRRYSYTDFKVLGRYHIPQLASRAVIDSKAGLMYAATVTNPSAARINWIDNASASGDIAVYDLKQIRDGKTADGKELKNGADLKPIATIGVRHTIHALELSNDGKSLYVLVTASSTKKSALVVIDTETRKDTRIPLPAPVRDMAKAGDGKNLLIIEDFSSKTKKSNVGTFDIESKSLINIVSFDGAVLDVAPIKGGGAVVTVLPVKTQPVGGGFGGPPGGISGPPGGISGPPGAGPGVGVGGPPGGGGGNGSQPAHQFNFQLHLINEKGSTEMDLGAAHRFSNGGYAEFDPENKKLILSSFRATGLDVFDVTDVSAANGVKLTATIFTAGREQLGGHCVITPDGKALLFHTGIVVDINNVGGSAPASGAPGLGGGIAPPGGFRPPPGGAPGGVGPAAPGGIGPAAPGGAVPPGMGVPPLGPNPGAKPPGPGSPNRPAPGGVGAPGGGLAPAGVVPAGPGAGPMAPGGGLPGRPGVNPDDK